MRTLIGLCIEKFELALEMNEAYNKRTFEGDHSSASDTAKRLKASNTAHCKFCHQHYRIDKNTEKDCILQYHDMVDTNTPHIANECTLMKCDECGFTDCTNECSDFDDGRQGCYADIHYSEEDDDDEERAELFSDLKESCYYCHASSTGVAPEINDDSDDDDDDDDEEDDEADDQDGEDENDDVEDEEEQEQEQEEEEASDADEEEAEESGDNQEDQ